MSGVVMEDGTQFERCNGCAAWVDIDALRYERPSLLHKYGRDLCGKCAAPAPGIAP